MKSKHLLTILVLAAVGVGLWVWGIGGDEGPSESSRFNGSNNERQQQPGGSQPSANGSAGDNDSEDGETVEEVPNALDGELMASDDNKRGNLRLKLADSGRVIYLNTSRDFTSLIGKQVRVSIEGSVDDFRLLDIKER